MRKYFCVLAVATVTCASHAQVVISGDLTSGLPGLGNIDGPATGSGVPIANAPFWDFWTFSANVGDAITIEVDRMVAALDPASSVVFGNASGLAFASLTGTDVFNWSGPGLSANLAFGDDDDAPATGVGSGPFGDPHYDFVATSTGVHTVAVASFLSTGPIPTSGYGYSIVVTGSTVPAPGALALLGLAGIFAARRRRN